jgi:hypothetical protein
MEKMDLIDMREKELRLKHEKEHIEIVKKQNQCYKFSKKKKK